MANVLKQALGLILLFEIIYCLQLIPERTNVTFFNPEYIDFVTVQIKRYGRKSAYYMNFHSGVRHSWNNNVTFHFIFYEYLHNEYQRSFVEMHLKYCDLINKDPYIGTMLAKTGIICPAPPREYHLNNMTLASENFNYVFPFEKGRVNIECTLTDTGESIARGYIQAVFKASKKRKS